MKNAFSLVLMLIVSISLLGQNSNLDYNNGIKLYNLTSFDDYSYTRSTNDTLWNHYHYTISNLQILHPSIAFQWKDEKNNFHEIELSSFTLGNQSTKTELVVDTSSRVISSTRSDLLTTFISAQYEYTFNFNKLKDSRFVPAVGIGINPYFKQTAFEPEASSEFPTSQTYIGTKVFLIPRLTYYFSSKFFMDINIPLCLFDDYFFIDKVDNPSLPIGQRTQSTLNFQQLPMIFRGRIGIGIKI